MRAALVALLGALVLALPAGAANPKDPQQRHTAADTQLATSIALKKADVATGWHADKTASGSNDAPCKSQPDESSLVQTALVDHSFTYRDGVTNIGSEVDVFRSAREARLDWKLSTLPALRDCIASALQTGAQTRVTVKSSKRLPISRLSERTLYYRIVMVIHTAKPVTIVADVVAIGKGRVTAVFHSFTVGSPLPSADMMIFARLLAGRLNAAKTI
jgi:hypothetical protein